MFMKHEESLMWEIKINNKGIKMLYIYMNLGFVFSVFFFFLIRSRWYLSCRF